MRKKVLCMILASIFCLCGLGMLAGCGEEVPPVDLTGKGQEMWEIKKDYKNHLLETSERYQDAVIDDFKITLFGEFHGVYVMYIDWFWDHAQKPTMEEVDGVEFWHSEVRSFDVYHNGKFYSLQEVFDLEIISHEDLLQLKENIRIGLSSVY